jgi:hypothetical protein
MANCSDFHLIMTDIYHAKLKLGYQTLSKDFNKYSKLV